MVPPRAPSFAAPGGQPPRAARRAEPGSGRNRIARPDVQGVSERPARDVFAPT